MKSLKVFRTIIMVIVGLFMIMSSASFAASSQPALYRGTLYVNEHKITNSNVINPIVVYNGKLYYPLSENDLSLLGIGLSNLSAKSFKLYKTTVSQPENIDLGNTYIKKANKVSGVSLKYNGNNIVSKLSAPIISIGERMYIPLDGTTLSVLSIPHVDQSQGGIGLAIDTRGSKYLDKLVSSKMAKTDVALASHIMRVNRGVSRTNALKYVGYINKASKKHNIDKIWIAAIAWKESTYRNVDNGAGAIGMMQMMESTGKRFGLTRKDLLNPEKNIEVCVKYLSSLRSTFKGDIRKATLAYNQGPRNVSRGAANPSYLNDVTKKYNSIKAYVNR